MQRMLSFVTGATCGYIAEEKHINALNGANHVNTVDFLGLGGLNPHQRKHNEHVCSASREDEVGSNNNLPGSVAQTQYDSDHTTIMSSTSVTQQVRALPQQVVMTELWNRWQCYLKAVFRLGIGPCNPTSENPVL